MISLARLLRLWPAIQEAKDQVEKSRAEQAQSHLLADEVSRLHQENRITARVHQAMRGGRA